MGGPPVSALDLSGHYTPTTGNARGATYIPGVGGAGISPNARAQAPEHPAVTVARHILRQHAARHGGGGGPGGVNLKNYASVVGDHGSWPTPPDWGGQNVPPPAAYGHSQISPNFQGGGGVMGSSPVMNAGAYTPQGGGVTGQTSQGGGLGSIATARGAAGGFGDLFGGGERAGFARGGDSSATADPFLAAITASSPQIGGGGGHGPPQPPEAPKPPAQGSDPAKGLGDSIGKLGDATKKMFGGQQQQTVPTAPTGGDAAGFDPTDASGGWGGMAGMPDTGDASLGISMGDAFGFKTGGGVGLGSLRGGFSDGGTPDLDALDAEVAGTGPPAAAQPVAAPAPATGGGGGVPEMIRQSFGDRAGYASTVSRLESGYGKNYVGDDNSSYGPYQLHYGGVSQKYPHPGLGDEFTKQTGLDARDPKTVPDQIKFVANYTAKHGWNDWSTKAQADRIAGGGGGGGGGGDVPSAAAQPASASTESYGGGFQLPGSQPSGPPPGQLDRNNLQAPTMGDELKHDPFGYLMTVGAGMMASRSPWLGVGVGEGLEAGGKYLQAQKGLEKDWGYAQAQINNMSQEAREHGADADLKVQQIQAAALAMKIKIAALRAAGLNIDDGGGAASPAPAGGLGTGLQPTQPLGGGTGSSGAPGAAGGTGGAGPVVAGAAAPSGTAPAQGAKPTDFQTAMQALEAEFKRQQALEMGGVLPPGGSNLVRQQIIEAQKAGRIITQDGRVVIDPSFVSQEAAEEGAKRGAGAYGEAANKAMGEEEDEVADKQPGLQQQLSQLNDASALLDAFKPGAGATEIANAQNVARRLGIDLGDPSAVMEFEKLSKEASWGLVKGMKGAVRNVELNQAGAQVFSPNISDPANRYLINRLKGAVQQNLEYSNNFMDWRSGEGKTAQSPNMFRAKWFKEHPYEKYIDQGLTVPKAPKIAERPEGVPPSARHQTGTAGTKRWFDPKTGKSWAEDGTPQ